jgi:hypothetical protein
MLLLFSNLWPYISAYCISVASLSDPVAAFLAFAASLYPVAAF